MNENQRNTIPIKAAQDAEHTMFIIWCDGSYCGGLNRGAWGAVILSHDNRKFKRSGFLGECVNSTHAELASVVESLRLIPEESHVTVMNDCMPVVELIQKIYAKSNYGNDVYPEWVDGYAYLLDALSVELERLGKVDIQWVKGHATDLNNKAADKLAKKSLSDNTHLPDYSIQFDGEKHPYWRSYTDQISKILGKNGFALKPGDAGFLSKKMCMSGLINANTPCSRKHPQEFIPVDNLLRLAEQMDIRKFPERSVHEPPRKRMGIA